MPAVRGLTHAASAPRRVMLAALASSLLAACTPIWPQVLGNAGHSNSNPAETALSSTVASARLGWITRNPTTSAVVDGSMLFDAEEPVGVRPRRSSSPGSATRRPRWTSSRLPGVVEQVVADGAAGTLYAASDSAVPNGAHPYDLLTVAALSQSTGAVAWSHTVKEPVDGVWLTFGDGRLFVGTGTGTTAYDNTGRALWTNVLATASGSYSAGRYYLGGAVLNASDGTLPWRNDLRYTPEVVMESVNGDLVVVGGRNGLANDPTTVPWPGIRQQAAASQHVPPSAPSRPPASSGTRSPAKDKQCSLRVVGVEAFSLIREGSVAETSDQDMIFDVAAGDLVWTLDTAGTFRAYPLAGCGHPVCAPLKSPDPSMQPSTKACWSPRAT